MRIVLATKPGVDQPWITDAVARLARQTGASVAVVAVDHVELERFSPAPRTVFVQGAREAAETAAQRLTAEGIEAVAAVRSGRTLEGIMAFADEQVADLIVVGASTRPAVAERLLGSVPLELVKKSTRPVMVVTHP
ncbi:universal stress protein [Actinoplanes sp. NPDC049118]|uniref:universal stress protein n=1 Tax=Actinoplanes sp. NPDC049118 TaxID=3155769 RepID=UPI0033E48C0D